MLNQQADQYQSKRLLRNFTSFHLGFHECLPDLKPNSIRLLILPHLIQQRCQKAKFKFQPCQTFYKTGFHAFSYQFARSKAVRARPCRC
jgi:hypothetical protein